MFLEIERVQAHYGATQVLTDIVLGIAEAEMHVMLGPSGCGKTTLLRSIAGLQAISGGEIRLGGQRIDQKPPAARGLAMVFQHYALFPNMSVRGNLAFALGRRGLDRAQIADRVDRMLHTVDLTARADAMPEALSGGQRQRVALARALVVEPKLLLLDEPLSALDAQIRKRLQLELKRMQRQLGLTAILVTHDQDEAMRMGDRITVLNAGRIAQTDLAENVFHRPADLFVARFMGEANILPAHLLLDGATGLAVVHPAALTLGISGGPKIEARVIDTELLGQTTRLNCRFEEFEVKVDAVYDPDTRIPATGEVVTISAARRNIHLIDPNQPQKPAALAIV